MAGQVYVGTSGWNYKHWRGGIYEPGISPKHWLTRVATTFNAVEVNSSFYRTPMPATVAAWQTSTPPYFRLALKLFRGITHYRKLRDTRDLTLRFLESAEVLRDERRGPLLIQLPPNMSPDAPLLEDYISEWREHSSTGWQIAVEFRNAAWLYSDICQLLNRLQVALCLHDMQGRGAVDTPNDVNFVYIRRHGTHEGRYSGSYSPAAIAQDAAHIRTWSEQGRDVYVFYNNDIGGHAWHNALALRQQVPHDTLTES